MVRRAHQKTQRCNQLHRATTLDNLTTSDPDHFAANNDEPDMKESINGITHVLIMIQRNIQKHALHQTQVPTFKGQKRRYNEIEHLLLNHIRRFQNKITREEKLQFFTSLLKEDAIEFCQTIRVTSDTTLREVPQLFLKENARVHFNKVSPNRWDQLEYDPRHKSSSGFLKHLKKTAKQAFDPKANEYVKAFLFGKLPVAIQNDFSVAGQRDAIVDEIKDYLQQRCQEMFFIFWVLFTQFNTSTVNTWKLFFKPNSDNFELQKPQIPSSTHSNNIFQSIQKS